MNKTLLFAAIHVISMSALAAGPGNFALEEVIVTAQKTEETVQSVPISIQALDAKTLQNHSINSLYDINTLVPSLKFTPYPTADQNLLVTLRGLSPSALELTQDTPTAVHINGVYIARGNGLNMSVADLERVEVLRGPQGTLYGRNATAGAINMITTKPGAQFSFAQQVTVASRNALMSKTSLNLPVTDNFFVKIAYLYDDKDGFVKNSAPNGIDFGERNAQAARFDARWQPSSDVTVDYSYDWGHQRYYTTPEQCFVVATGSPLSASMDPNQCSPSFKGHLAYYGSAPKNTVTIDGHALSVEWELSPVTLRSITAYRTLDDKYYGVTVAGGENLTAGTFDVSLPGFNLPAEPDRTRQHQFSQEFQIFGELGEQLSYTAGLYYFKEGGSEKQPLSSALVAVSPVYTTVVDGGPRDLSGVENESKAAFAQFTWTPPILGGNLDIVPGIRYTRDSRKASLYQHNNGMWIVLPNGMAIPNSSIATEIGTPTDPANFDKDFSKTTPSLTLQYHFNADVLGYAKYAKGYKSGGTAIRSSSTQAFENGFGPETLDSIELGLKSSWLDQRLRVNADVFQSKFKDQQVSVRNLSADLAGVAVVPYDIVNAGRSTYQGAELEVQAAITENLRLSANYAYLHFEYDKVNAGDSGIKVTDFYHNVVPTNAYTLNADYTVGLGDIGKLGVNLNYSYTDPIGSYQDGYDIVGGEAHLVESSLKSVYVTPSYGIWNGRIALSEIQVGPSDKGNLTVALWGKNLTDKRYINFRTAGVSVAAVSQGFWGEPRTVGLDLIYRYE